VPSQEGEMSSEAVEAPDASDHIDYPALDSETRPALPWSPLPPPPVDVTTVVNPLARGAGTKVEGDASPLADASLPAPTDSPRRFDSVPYPDDTASIFLDSRTISSSRH
jgi:hypothetical protein